MRRVDLMRRLLKEAGHEPEHGLGGYSGVLRRLRRKTPELVRPFMESFKLAFDLAMQEQHENAVDLALMEALQSIGVQIE